MKSRTRIVEKKYWSESVFYIAQIYAGKPFDKWLTVGVASSEYKARKIIEEFET